jgi:hypothetical protein
VIGRADRAASATDVPDEPSGEELSSRRPSERSTVREWLGRYGTRVRSELDSAVAERRPPREIAASFSVGLFVTALPSLGTGLLLLFLLVAVSERVEQARAVRVRTRA